MHNVGSRAVHSMVALSSGANVPAHSPVSATVMGKGALTHCRRLWPAWRLASATSARCH